MSVADVHATERADMREHFFAKPAHHLQGFRLVLAKIRRSNHLVDAEFGILGKTVNHFRDAANEHILSKFLNRLCTGQRFDDPPLDNAGTAKDIIKALVVAIGVRDLRVL